MRTQYLTFLQGLPAAFDEQRKQAVTDTAGWLKRHDDNSDVRTQYLTFLQGLPPAFDEQRKQAVTDTADWLKRHDDDSTETVRTRYLTFLQGLSAAFDEQRTDAAKATCDWLERLIARNPANFGHNFIYAEQLRRLSRFEEAIVQYDFVLNRHKGHQIARRGRAIALQKLGRVSEAEAEFKHALWWAGCNEQSQAIFHTSLGEFYLETKRWPEAINSFQQAQKEFPDYFGNHWGIAKAQIGLGNFDKAEEAVQRALEDPNLKPPARDEIVQFLADIRLRRSS